MANDPMMDMGGFQFGIETAPYEQLRRTWAWRWVPQDVLNAPPSYQYVGTGHEELVINGYITPHFKGGLHQVEAMRREARKGETLIVVDSLGDVWGTFVITEIVETKRDVGPAGLPFRIEFRLTLLSTV